MKIDLVIPYVNGSDPVWQNEYEKFREIKSVGEANTINRYRDYGTLKYLFRGVEMYAPWINKIFLILSGPSQIPDWLDTSNPRLRIVYHSDYIPKKFLPTFNTNTIECFLHNIPDLSEYFIYGNDDMFITKPLKPDQFFSGDTVKVNIRFKRMKDSTDLYQQMWHNNLFFSTLGMDKSYRYIVTDHGYLPRLKSLMKSFFNIWGDKALSTFTQIRDPKNITGWCFDSFAWFKRQAKPSSIRNKVNAINNQDSNLFELAEEYDSLCINDQISFDFEEIKYKQLQFMELYYPHRCSFEKELVNQNKLVSIITPSYNGANRIIPMLNSIKAQSYQNFECLIIDDGSTDNLSEVISNYNDARFRCISKSNGGVGSARNLGIQLAKGDYICFADDDDTLNPERLMVCVDYLNNHPDENACWTMLWKYKPNPVNWYFKCNYYQFKDLYEKNKSNFSGVHPLFGRSEFIKQFKFSDSPIAEDTFFHLDLLVTNGHAPVLNYYGYNYLMRPDSAITSKSWSEEKQRLTLKLYNDVLDKYKNADDSIKTQVLKCWKMNFMWMHKKFTLQKEFDNTLKRIDTW